MSDIQMIEAVGIGQLPERIETAIVQQLKVNHKLRDLRSHYELHLAEKRIEVWGAKDSNGKALFSNETLRESALLEALAVDDDYQEMLRDLELLEDQKAIIAASIERYRSEFRLAMIDYEADRLGRRNDR